MARISWRAMFLEERAKVDKLTDALLTLRRTDSAPETATVGSVTDGDVKWVEQHPDDGDTEDEPA